MLGITILYIFSLVTVGCGSKTVYEGFSDISKQQSTATTETNKSDDSLGDKAEQEVPKTGDSNQKEDSKAEEGQEQTEGSGSGNDNQGMKDSEGVNGSAISIGTPECVEADQTRSVLLTKTISRELIEKSLDYEIFALDCAGKKIDPSHIAFDFSYIVNQTDTITYQITHADTNEVLMSGDLELIKGQDIFGNQGDNLVHFKTNKEIDFGSNSKLIFSVDLSAVEFVEARGMNDYDQLPTYLKIGHNKPSMDSVKLLERGCLTADESRIEALTKKLDIKLETAVDISLEYVLYSKDCLGNPIAANEIKFDLNYKFELNKTESHPVTYTIIDTETNQTVGAGSLILIRGEDLFGNTGSRFFHYKTDGDFDFPSKWDKLKLIINWSDAIFLESTTEGDDPNMLPSFIKFGQDLEPTKKVIELNITP